MGGGRDGERGENIGNVRDLSCLLRCSLLLKALLQNWHLYFRSGTREAFREAGVEEAEVGRTATLAPGILNVRRVSLLPRNPLGTRSVNRERV